MRHPRRTATILLALLLACSLPDPARAAWPHDPDVNVTLSAATNTQQTPQSCSDGAGGAIVTWFDLRAGNYDVYVQRVSRDGTVMWTEDGVAVCTAAGTQYYPAICSDGAGGAIITWQDNRSGVWDIYVQRVHANGVPQWTANGVALCSAADAQQSPDICSDGAGGAIVVWRDYRNGADNNLYVRRINSSGVVQWTSNGVAICTSSGDQSNVRIVSDGAGGAVMAWQDYRNATDYNIYAQRVNSGGAVQWTANGVVLCDVSLGQWNLAIASDGAGGAIVTWGDTRSGESDIYAQRVSGGGAPQWTADGVAVCTSTDAQEAPSIQSDGSGGAILVWQDYRNGSDYNVYAQKVKGDGNPQWTANGVSLCTATGGQNAPRLVSDGAGGAIATWADFRTGGTCLYARRVSASGAQQWTSNGVALSTIGNADAGFCIAADDAGGAIVAFASTHGVGTYDIYAQRVDRFGAIGEAEPGITAVADVSGDQGGKVVVEWTASYLDAEPAFGIEDYSVWRQVPSSLVTAELVRAAAAPAVAGPGDERRALRTTTLGAQTEYWEYVGSVPARAREGYSLVAGTTTDSMAGANPYTRFMVSAEASGWSYYWDSAPDSGYSVDDLAPPMPQPFTGDYADGTSRLQWGVNPAPDFAVFRLYRGGEVTFEPDAGNLIATLATCAYADAAGGPAWYKLCAVDIHGNASPCAEILPNGAVDVPGPALPRELALSAPAPNPLRGSSTLRLALPRAARVSLAVYDQQGRRVRTLLSAAQPAGEHTLVWDGRDEGGRPVPSGMYFVRCEVDGRTLTRRIAALR